MNSLRILFIYTKCVISSDGRAGVRRIGRDYAGGPDGGYGFYVRSVHETKVSYGAASHFLKLRKVIDSFQSSIQHIVVSNQLSILPAFLS